MKKHALLLSDVMVRAFLAGQKHVTRRLPGQTNSLVDGKRVNGKRWKEYRFARASYHVKDNVFTVYSDGDAKWHRVEPIYQAGDELWFRESFRVNSWTPDDGEINFRYEADGLMSGDIYFEEGDAFINYWVQSCEDLADSGYEIDEDENYADYDYKALRLRPSIHMPYSACRLFATCSGVTCEPLQAITEEQARAEGLSMITKDDGRTWKYGIPDSDGLPGTDNTGWPWQDWEVKPIKAYARLWDKINGSESWLANPPVYAINFTPDNTKTYQEESTPCQP